MFCFILLHSSSWQRSHGGWSSSILKARAEVRDCLTCCHRMKQSSELKPKVNITLKTHPTDPLLSHRTHSQEFYNFSKHHHQLGPSFHPHEPGGRLERQMDAGVWTAHWDLNMMEDSQMHLLGCRVGKFKKRATKINKQEKNINSKNTFQVISSWDLSTFIK